MEVAPPAAPSLEGYHLPHQPTTIIDEHQGHQESWSHSTYQPPSAHVRDLPSSTSPLHLLPSAPHPVGTFPPDVKPSLPPLLPATYNGKFIDLYVGIEKVFAFFI